MSLTFKRRQQGAEKEILWLRFCPDTYYIIRMIVFVITCCTNAETGTEHGVQQLQDVDLSGNISHLGIHHQRILRALQVRKDAKKIGFVNTRPTPDLSCPRW